MEMNELLESLIEEISCRVYEKVMKDLGDGESMYMTRVEAMAYLRMSRYRFDKLGLKEYHTDNGGNPRYKLTDLKKHL